MGRPFPRVWRLSYGLEHAGRGEGEFTTEPQRSGLLLALSGAERPYVLAALRAAARAGPLNPGRGAKPPRAGEGADAAHAKA